MYTVSLLPEAEEEIKVACEWYESKQVGVATNFLKELDHYLTLISHNPQHFQVRFSEVYRFTTLKVFPYFIVFKIHPAQKAVLVLSVFHTSRNPSVF